MTKEDLQMVGFEIVAYAGDARSSLLTLLREVRAGNFENVEAGLASADENLKLAHNAQTKILAEEAKGEDLDVGFIFIHGQDHLMTTLLLRELIQDFIELYRKDR
ncbi:PTS lactose/cellobiose transporter subunit IIA [Priestia endophytica]|jgi:PTS system lactose-specific IIA component|uniref:PTS system lactose-specific EIIA component n=2 Tax=Priestia endophytica TaxID=135735 RepID=A0AAX1Q984_9BACI|nr:PTS lactose/cellobiose transporter subunit IIA [Priestia endophytica]KAB2494067.1 PTS lactose/cellobiose transporter subunit IIA [Priestia endophytica]KYG29849.1 PTS lactose transporter subunit IIA [Priestia endophytica]MBG9812611.1 PTS system lactose-specific transporter subunit IIA [Priestia endophytica]MCM3538117.1 PTS lactose/cellobiose transporter subunit IIA [Priestia endophytica]RAS76070.1 PTS lactose transporter subunit IIA [Priestia endophytica]